MSARRHPLRNGPADALEVPAQVAALVAAWCVSRRPRQRAITWPRERWRAKFPDRAAVFERLPDQLDREEVRAAVGTALARDDVIGAFLPCMAWGFGRVGYGSHRVTTMLAVGERHVTEKLSPVVQAAAAGDPVGAYELLASTSRLDGLGPAFGTKFIYFVDRRGLILDRIIAASLANVGALSINPVRWDSVTYADYLALMRGWARQLLLQPDELEQVLFTAQSGLAGNQWAGDE